MFVAEDRTKAAICPGGLAESRPGCFREGKPNGDPVQAQDYALEVNHTPEARGYGGARAINQFVCVFDLPLWVSVAHLSVFVLDVCVDMHTRLSIHVDMS